MNEEKWIAWEMQTSKKWSDMEDVLKYTNIDLIDYDHKMLVEYALKLNQVIDKSETNFSLVLVQETKELLDMLYHYAEDHFTREEHFMDLYMLPNIGMHKREHQRILDMLKEALDSFNKGKVRLTRQLKVQIMDWLINHINIVDCEFFKIENWSKNIVKASNWEDVKPIIRLIGISEIDNQHQRLTEIALIAMKKIAEDPQAVCIEKSCGEILDFAAFHFAFEAEFMAKYKIKEAEQHNRIHQVFIDTINEYSQKMQTDFTLFETMKTWILTWWIEHINTTDRDYFSYKNWAYQLMEQAEEIEEVSVVLRRTDIEVIDNDHLALMELTFKLNQMINRQLTLTENGAAKEGHNKEIVGMLDAIYSKAAAHFEVEEKLMASKEMDDLRSHTSEHQDILEKLKAMKENYIAGRLYLSANLKTMILEWWIMHTNTTDYRTFVQNYHQ